MVLFFIDNGTWKQQPDAAVDYWVAPFRWHQTFLWNVGNAFITGATYEMSRWDMGNGSLVLFIIEATHEMSRWDMENGSLVLFLIEATHEMSRWDIGAWFAGIIDY